MNPNQMAQQIKHLLEQVAWPAGSTDVVFGNKGGVRVFVGEPTEEQMPAALPFALVGIGAGTADDDDPELLTQSFLVTSVVGVKGDAMGEFALIGGAHADIGKSAGRGAAEVSERVRSAIQDLTGADGNTIQVRTAELSAPSPVKAYHVTGEKLSVQALCTSLANYTAPQELAEASSVWTWAGSHCSSRFDFIQFRLGFKAGAVPPETPDDADGIVYTGTAPTTTIVPLAGHTYAVFADYNSRSSALVIEGTSSGSEVGSFLIQP